MSTGTIDHVLQRSKKYKGKRLRDIDDKGYLEWLIRQNFIDNGVELAQAAQQLLDEKYPSSQSENGNGSDGQPEPKNQPVKGPGKAVATTQWRNKTQREKRDTVKRWIEQRRRDFENMTMGLVRPDVIAAAMLAAAQNSPDLWDCSEKSWQKALINLCQIQLIPNTPQDHAYLVPFKNKDGIKEVVVIIGYIGFMELAYRSDKVVKIWADLVYKADKFEETKGTEARLIHEAAPPEQRQNLKDVTHAYAVAKLTTGDTAFIVMARHELDKIEENAPSRNSPARKNWPEEMMKKAPIRRLRKFIPSSNAFALAANLDDRYAGAESQVEVPAVDYTVEDELDDGAEPTTKASSKLVNQLKQKKEKKQAAQKPAEKPADPKPQPEPEKKPEAEPQLDLDAKKNGRNRTDLERHLFELLTQNEDRLKSETIDAYNPELVKDFTDEAIEEAIAEVERELEG